MPASTSLKVVLVVAIAVTGLIAGMLTAQLARTPTRPDIDGLLWPNPKQVAPFELTAGNGAAFDAERLLGRWTFLFFGYTYCPDVCPNTLASMASVMKSLRADGADEQVQMVFVSVDPARDSLARMNEYVTYFDAAFIGATSTDEAALQRFTRDLGVLYVRQTPDRDGRYEVDHTASVMLIDPGGRLVGILSAPHVPDQIAARFKRIRAFVEDAS